MRADVRLLVAGDDVERTGAVNLGDGWNVDDVPGVGIRS